MSVTAEPRTMYTLPDGAARWRIFNIWRGPPANTGAPIGELTEVRSRRFHFDLYGAATAEGVIDGRSPQCATLQELSQDLAVHRFNPYNGRYDIIFRGPVGHTQDTISETVHTVQLWAADYRSMLKRCIVDPATYTATDQATIAANLVGPYLTGGAANRTMMIRNRGLFNPDGTLLGTTGVNRDRTYLGTEMVTDMVDNLSQCIGGFDWSLMPADPFGSYIPAAPIPAADLFVWYPQRGVTKPFVAEWGATVSSLSRTVDSTGFANYVLYGGASGVAPAVSRGDQWTNPQLHPEGLWQTYQSEPTTSQPATLQQAADGILALMSVLVPSYSLTLAPGVWNGPADCWLGDTITVRVQSGRLNVTGTAVRIVQIDIDVSDDGVEVVKLTVARAVPTLANLLVGQQSYLDALSRR